MNVLHLDTGRAFRGGQRQVLLLLHGLTARGHASMLLAPAGPLLDRAARAGVACAPWTAAGDLDLAAGVRANRARGTFAPAVVHAHTAHAVGAALHVARRLGAPAVASRRVSSPVGGGILGRWKHGRGVARYLCVSGAAAAALRDAGVAAERIAIVPSGVDVAALDAVRERVARGEAASLRREIGAPADAEVVGTVAAVTTEKRPALWLEVAAAVIAARPASRFVWIGDGPDRASLIDGARRRGLSDRVSALGFREDAHELLAQFTLFLLTSRHEGLGTSVLDAQVLGVPVVATGTGGIGEIVRDGLTGGLADADTVADRVRSALADPATLKAWSTAGRGAAAAWSAEAMVEATLAQYVAVTAAGGAGGTG